MKTIVPAFSLLMHSENGDKGANYPLGLAEIKAFFREFIGLSWNRHDLEAGRELPKTVARPLLNNMQRAWESPKHKTT